MVLIGASVISKSGKSLLARVFISDMTKARLEGLLDAFPKLIASDKTQRQHTFVETDSVRYVYHPMDNVYMVLITTKASNILEDLETLRLFSRVIPEYCRSNDEKEIQANLFDLIFAFDEIVALGYRENVNLAQIRTFTEMDSHEERVFNQIKIAQERAANEMMTQKANELKKLKAEQKKSGRGAALGIGGTATSVSSSATPLAAVIDDVVASVPPPKPAQPQSRGGGRALKLGTRKPEEENFLKQLKSEGQLIASIDNSAPVSDSIDSTGVVSASVEPHMPIHIKTEEKISAVVSRDGGLENCEILGTVSLLLIDSRYSAVSIQMRNGDKYGAQLQVHPNLDRKEWQQKFVLRPKSSNKPFPINIDIGVLKWRLQLASEEDVPLAINCWPNENPDGCTVNIEYTLQAEHLVLNNVIIVIPLPPATPPVVSECEGTYEYVKSKSQLLWCIELVDEANKTGSMEFSVPNGHSDHFFPVSVRFSSKNLFCDITPQSVHVIGSDESEEFSSESRFYTEKFEII